MGSVINILPVLYDENSHTGRFQPIKDFNQREWLEGNNYWFKMLEDLADVKFNYSETDTTLFIMYNGQSEQILGEGQYFEEAKTKMDIGEYKQIIFFQNEVNWDTFERLLGVEDFFYEIFKFDKRFKFIRNIFNSRFAFTKINAEFGFGCFPFQLIHNFKQTEDVDYTVEKKFHMFSANCNVKEDRLHLYSMLERGNYWDKCNTSFFLPLFGYGNKKFRPIEYMANFGAMDIETNYVPKKLKYDNELNVKNLALQDSLECSFQAIFETRYHSHCGIVLSEKLFKGFLYKTPFITFAQHGTLKTLRELGFSTFDWLIDESYDEEINDRKRLKMVLDEIERLLNTPIKEIEDKIKEHEYELNWNRERVRIFAQLEIDKIINLFDAE
jgi:hypothetical protein